MTRYNNTVEGLADETAISTTNSGGASGDAFGFVTIAGGTLVADDAHASHGTKAVRVTPGSSALNSYGYQTTGSGRVSLRSYVYVTQAVATGMNLGWIGAGTTRVANVELRPSGGGNKIRVNDASSATSAVYTSTTALPFNQWVRLELDVTVGTTTSNGRIRFAMYTLDSTTPIDTVYDSSALNTGTVSLTRGLWGAFSSTTDTTPFWVDSMAWDDAATGFVGPYVEPLATPVTTLGTTTNATSPGGTGSQVVTWPAVANATSYEAWIANSSSPLQSDFTLVASGVTSPYTFTGVSVGAHSYGIKAKA